MYSLCKYPLSEEILKKYVYIDAIFSVRSQYAMLLTDTILAGPNGFRVHILVDMTDEDIIYTTLVGDYIGIIHSNDMSHMLANQLYRKVTQFNANT